MKLKEFGPPPPLDPPLPSIFYFDPIKVLVLCISGHGEHSCHPDRIRTMIG